MIRMQAQTLGYLAFVRQVLEASDGQRDSFEAFLHQARQLCGRVIPRVDRNLDLVEPILEMAALESRFFQTIMELEQAKGLWGRTPRDSLEFSRFLSNLKSWLVRSISDSRPVALSKIPFPYWHRYFVGLELFAAGFESRIASLIPLVAGAKEANPVLRPPSPALNEWLEQHKSDVSMSLEQELLILSIEFSLAGELKTPDRQMKRLIDRLQESTLHFLNAFLTDCFPRALSALRERVSPGAQEADIEPSWRLFCYACDTLADLDLLVQFASAEQNRPEAPKEFHESLRPLLVAAAEGLAELVEASVKSAVQSDLIIRLRAIQDSLKRWAEAGVGPVSQKAIENRAAFGFTEEIFAHLEAKSGRASPL
jgi:hypothetical protein